MFGKCTILAIMWGFLKVFFFNFIEITKSLSKSVVHDVMGPKASTTWCGFFLVMVLAPLNMTTINPISFFSWALGHNSLSSSAIFETDLHSLASSPIRHGRINPCYTLILKSTHAWPQDLGPLHTRAIYNMKLWEPKIESPKAVPRHLQNHVVWSRTLKFSVKSYVTGPSTKC